MLLSAWFSTLKMSLKKILNRRGPSNRALWHTFAGVSPFNAVGTQFYPLFPVAQVAADQSTRTSERSLST